MSIDIIVVSSCDDLETLDVKSMNATEESVILSKTGFGEGVATAGCCYCTFA